MGTKNVLRKRNSCVRPVSERQAGTFDEMKHISALGVGL